ncbi:MAG TPA: D-xylose transporter XylE [Microscillaceae bacterium]|nr:D-xylose transporter XylE [Microscillaceae bacterium]
MNERKYQLRLIYISVVAALGGFLFGYDTGVINGTQFYFSKYFELSPAAKGWVVGSALLGCFVGALIAGYVSKKYGRKFSLIVSAILFTISAWGSGLPSFLPESVSLLVVFRIIGGLGIGVASMNAPTYIAELSPAHKRGQMVTFYQMAIVLGFFLVFIATYFIGAGNSAAYNTSYGWRVMFWSELVPCLLFLGLLFFVPKSPRWLCLQGRYAEAQQVLEGVQSPEVAASELESIKESIHEDQGLQLNQALKGVFLPIIFIGVVFSVLQQFTGINAVLYYGADIFEKALGFGQEDVLAQQIMLAAVNVIFTVLAMFTVDRWGRKPLVIAGSLGMLVGFALLAISLQMKQTGIISLIGILMFIGSFAMSMGPIVWVVLSEMFPGSIRSLGMSLAVAFQWAANYLVSQTFPVVMESKTNLQGMWHGSLPYYIFIAFILVIIGFTLKYIPETKGKSLESIENLWKVKFSKS